VDKSYWTADLKGPLDVGVFFPGYREYVLVEQISLESPSPSACGDYAVFIEDSCQNFLIPELVQQADIDRINGEALNSMTICPATKQETGGRFVYIPEDRNNGNYISCEYQGNEIGSLMAYQVPYLNYNFTDGVKISYDVNGNFFAVTERNSTDTTSTSLFYEPDGFIKQVYYSSEVENIYLTMFFTPDDLWGSTWSYSFNQGVTGVDHHGQWVNFNDKEVLSVLLFGISNTMEKDMRFEAGVMTQCTLRNGNEILGSCM